MENLTRSNNQTEEARCNMRDENILENRERTENSSFVSISDCSSYMCVKSIYTQHMKRLNCPKQYNTIKKRIIRRSTTLLHTNITILPDSSRL